MGELVAWIIGWDLVLRVRRGRGDGRVGWSGHLVELLRLFGIELPAHLTNSPTVWCTAGRCRAPWRAARTAGSTAPAPWINLPAVFIVALMSTILVIGIKESASVNNLHRAAQGRHRAADPVHRRSSTCTRSTGSPSFRLTRESGAPRLVGRLRGAGLVFFAYIGFDAVSTAAQEAKNPRQGSADRNPGSLAICTVLYVAVSAVLTGMVSYTS
jgi:APA family basic amino acid/polyamine antiporter